MSYYQIGGSLHWDDPNYVRRQADIDLDRALSTGQFCYVFNARQMGKSSLMVRAFRQLQDRGVACAVIDLSRIGGQKVTLEQWYKGLAVELWQAFDLVQSVNLKAWWQERLDLSPVQRFAQWIEAVLLVEVKTAKRSRPDLVIFLDEVDSVCGLEFPIQDFFALIRACYNRRSLQPEYQRLTFALLGVARPSDLITDSQRTPFNIGTAIALEGFQLSEAQPLAQGLVGAVNDPQFALQEILTWTGGQPFLTQKLCRFLAEQPRTDLGDRLHIAKVVQQCILQSWEFQDDPEHLRTIRDRLLSNPNRVIQRLGLYQQVLDSAVSFQGSDEQIELWLSGLVSNQQEQLVVKNPIYRAIFHPDWVSQQLNRQVTFWQKQDRHRVGRFLSSEFAVTGFLPLRSL